MPVADCCCTVRADRSTLSHVSVTCSSSPEVSSIAFHAQPPDLPPVPLMELGFAVICPLARHRRPQIQFLSIGSRVCSTLLSDIASRRHLCASLSLHLHQVVKRTFTSKRLNMLGTHNLGRPFRAVRFSAHHPNNRCPTSPAIRQTFRITNVPRYVRFKVLSFTECCLLPA